MIGVTRRRVLTTTSPPPPPLPYDAKVEWIQLGGSKYINTGIIPTTAIKFVVDASFASSTAIYSGAYINNGRFQLGIYSSKFILGLYNKYAYATASLDTSRHTFILDAPNKEGKFDSETIALAYTTSPSMTSMTLYIGARNSSGTINTYNNDMKVYGVQIYDNGTLVFEGVPVRYNGEGYLYDSVSGDMFGNDGTGTITYGNDIVE